jgi:hypothetical protein
MQQVETQTVETILQIPAYPPALPVPIPFAVSIPIPPQAVRVPAQESRIGPPRVSSGMAVFDSREIPRQQPMPIRSVAVPLFQIGDDGAVMTVNGAGPLSGAEFAQLQQLQERLQLYGGQR